MKKIIYSKKYSTLLVLGCALTLFLFGQLPMSFGLIIGFILGLFCFTAIEYQANNLNIRTKKGKWYGLYAIRFLIISLVLLACGFLHDYINLILIGVGFVGFIMLTTYFNRKYA